MINKTNSQKLAQTLKISKARTMEAVIKAELISAILNAAKRQNLTHFELARRSGLSRSAVTGILSGSLQKVTIDRVLRLVEAANLIAEVQVKKVA